MTASQVTWVVLLGSLLVVSGIAASAAGLLSIASSPSHQSPSVPPQDGLNWSHPGGAFAVTFTESGLPNGTFWSVSLHGQWGPWFVGEAAGWRLAPVPHGFGWNGSTSNTIGFVVPNGTYDFFIPTAGNSTAAYSASPSYGNLTVNGSSVSVSVSFSAIPFYTVTFSETGLPSGTLWAVRLSGYGWGGSDWNSSTNSTVNFSRADGVYWFAVHPVWSSGGIYSVTPGRGTLTVNGTAVTVSITFSRVTFYNVTFAETGLPNGTNWSAALFGHGWGNFTGNCSSSDTLNLSRPDGTYWFFVPPAWTANGTYVASPQMGTLTLNGTDVVVNVTFTLSNVSWWGHATLRQDLRTNPMQSGVAQLARP